ncbi:uncharacterized protein LOC110708108 [Chenopodium quinoa]|uniref:uncharacterized protein LOC110708108 n=1 Tax=Chenopodium quinoa TaxID=63459 RepID=UPI000B77B9B4|nr:uncharacterized protein LOC110708108 [Chenopodium quinoa]
MVTLTRPQREIPNVPLAFRSPYMVKYKDLFKDEDTMNKLVTDYAYSGKDQSELLYYDGVNSINREEMKTLEGDTLVVNNVIDSWAVLLNQKRSKNKLYFSTFPHQIMYANTVCPEGSSMELRIAYFKERITNELRLYKIKSAVGYQQIFFPVAIYAHFYLLCIDHINETMHIIDNRKLPKHQTILKGYAEYLKGLGYEDADSIEKYKVVLQKMKWRSNEHYTNCGVYIMKHMETFTADPNEEWVCDLKPNNVNQIRKLRVQYTAELMLNEGNRQSQNNRRATRRFAQA